MGKNAKKNSSRRSASLFTKQRYKPSTSKYFQHAVRKNHGKRENLMSHDFSKTYNKQSFKDAVPDSRVNRQPAQVYAQPLRFKPRAQSKKRAKTKTNFLRKQKSMGRISVERSSGKKVKKHRKANSSAHAQKKYHAQKTKKFISTGKKGVKSARRGASARGA